MHVLVARGGVEDTKLKAKDTKKSETKAKDFKMCPQGQGCPKGLHHCLLQILYLWPPLTALLQM